MLCQKLGDMSVVIPDKMYSIPPVTGPLGCLGLPFDFLANEFEDGWVCASAVAVD